MKEKIKQFKIDLDYLVEFTQAEAHYEGKRELPHAAVVAGVLFDITVRHWVARLTCHLRGHQMMDHRDGVAKVALRYCLDILAREAVLEFRRTG